MSQPPDDRPLVVITVRCSTPEALKIALADGGELVGDLLNEPGIDDARIRKVIDGQRTPKGAASATQPACPAPGCPARPRKES